MSSLSPNARLLHFREVKVDATSSDADNLLNRMASMSEETSRHTDYARDPATWVAASPRRLAVAELLKHRMNEAPNVGHLRRPMRTPIKGLCIALLVLSFVACGRDSNVYHSCVASHDSIRPGMSIRQVFESGLADYLIRSDGKNVPGSTLPGKMPISSECSRYVVDVHCGGGAFSLRVYCNMNGPSNKQLVPPGLFSNKQDFLNGLDQFAHWTKSTSFRVESPALKIGGVYDSYEFAIDESGKVTSVSAIRRAP